MMKTLLLIYAFVLFISAYAGAQTRSNFTNGNTIFISIEGNELSYEYSSQNMLVRFNENTRKLECVLNLTHMNAANDASPIALVQDLFFAAKYPEFIVEIDAPTEKINAGNLSTETLDRRTRVFFQDMIKEQVMPVLFTPDKRAIMFSTTFDILLDNYQIQLPAKYTTMLTGRIKISIRNARWFDFLPR